MANDPTKELFGAIAGLLAPQEEGKQYSVEELRALKAARTPNAGVNTGGRHDPRMGMVQGNTQGPQRIIMPPSRGRTMTQVQGAKDYDALTTVMDSMGGTDVSGLAQRDPKQLVQAGVQALQHLAQGNPSQADRKAVLDFVDAVQSGIIPQSPAVNKLIDAMKSAKLLNQSNMTNF